MHSVRKHFFQEIVQWSETEQGRPWDVSREKQVFQDTRIRIAGCYDGYPRRATFGTVEEPDASPGQIMWPGVTLQFSTLSNRTYLRILGNFNSSTFPDWTTLIYGTLFRLPWTHCVDISTRTHLKGVHAKRSLFGSFCQLQFVCYDMGGTHVSSRG